MMNNNIISYLDELLPDCKCELNYSKDYELLIAIMLSAQSTDKRVNEVTKVLFSKYDSLEKLFSASLDDIKKIIRPVGSFNKKSLYIKDIVNKILVNGGISCDRNFLESMSGVGRKSTNVYLAIMYNYPLFAVDTHVSRVSKRLGIADDGDDVLVIEKKLMDYFPKEKWNRLHLQLVLFGRYYCKSRKPLCDECKLRDMCKFNKKV